MIRKALHPLRQYLYRYRFNHFYGFAGYVERQNNSLSSTINELRNIEEFKDFYKINSKQFNSNIFAIACRKLSRMVKDNIIPKDSKGVHNMFEQNLFLKDLINQDFSKYNQKELSGVSFLLRNLTLANFMTKQLYQIQRIIASESIERLSKQYHDLNSLINIYYDTGVFGGFHQKSVELLDKILYSLESENQRHIDERENLFLLHWNLILKGLLARNKLQGKQIIILNITIKMINDKIPTTPINELVESVCLMNQIKNTKPLYKLQNQMLIKMRDYLLENIDKLNVRSVFQIMRLNIAGEDFFFKNIYDKIIQNIFDTINEDGKSQLDDGIIIQCLKHFSKKSKPISILKPQYIPKFLKFIQIKLKTGEQNIKKMFLRQFPAFVLSQFIPFRYNKNIEQIVAENAQLPWSDFAIYSFSNRGISLQQYYQKNHIILSGIKDQEQPYKFLLRSINLKIQSQLNPENEKIKQLLAKAEIQISKINHLNLIRCSPEILRKFHYYFSPIYINNINLLSQQPSDLNNILEYYIYAFSSREIREYLNKKDKNIYQAAFLSLLKKRINRNIQKLQPPMLINIFTIISRFYPLHLNLKNKNQIFAISQFLCHNHLLIKLKPKYEQLTQQFYIIINYLANNIQSFTPQFEGPICRIILSLCQNTKLNKNTYYYLDFLKNALNIANILKSTAAKYAIANQCYQFGLMIDDLPVKRIQKQSQMINQLRKTQIMSKERIEQIVSIYKNKSPNNLTKILVFINPKNIQLFKALLSQFMMNATKLNQIKVFAINEILKNNFSIMKSKIYNDFIKNLGKFAEENFQKFNLYDHCRIILSFNNHCPQSYLQKFQNELNKTYITRLYTLKCLKTLFLLKQNINPAILQKIQYFKPRDLIFFTLLQEKNLEKVEQRLKIALQKKTKNQIPFDSLICQYIAKKYPNLKEIQSIPKVQSLIISKQQKMAKILQQLQKIGEIKISQQKVGQHTYYQINNAKIFLTKGFNSQKIQQFTKRIIKEVYNIEAILINFYSSQSYNIRLITQSLGLSSQNIKIEQSIEEINQIEDSQILNQDQTQIKNDQ